MAHNNLLAQVKHTYTITGPGVTPGANTTTQLEKIISNVIGVLSILSLIWFTIQTIFAGYEYISSEGDKNKLEKSRKRLTQGILGVTITLLAIFLASLLASLIGLKNPFSIDTQFTNMGL